MKKRNLLVFSFFLSLLTCAQVSFAQERKGESIPQSNSLEWFNKAADSHPTMLLFKALQYKAPFPGFYQEWTLGKNGGAFTGRIVPNWAVQASAGATLSSSQIDEVKGMLKTLSSVPAPPAAKPIDGELYTAFIFYDGQDYARYDYSGALPFEVQTILDFVESEIYKQEKQHLEEWRKRSERAKALYGDWQKQPGMIISAGSRMSLFKNAKGLFITETGQRRLSAENTAYVVLYHAIVFYPEGAVTAAGSGGKYFSDEPLSSELIIWTLPKNNSADEAEEKRLEIEYDAISDNLSIGSDKFPLSHGNMFIIRMNEKWSPVVTQINDHLTDLRDDQKALDYFESVLPGDQTIRGLVLAVNGRTQ